ncbi:helix-turn-helix transcriptional regulator [uncultured Draconibacterium sp.]|uniref:helix-turn-helix domain-containing protein n=1 Tax=uncultured Draconibacterium sp. TaxID=1573823 RepID=UPI0032168928
MTSFGDYIKQEREKRGWTQTDLGAKLGINMTKISRIENNKDLFTQSKLEVLADIFDTNLTLIKELFFGDKFAKEAYKNGCSDKTFVVAEQTVQYFRTVNAKQGTIKF